jgi:hypothetical protein
MPFVADTFVLPSGLITPEFRLEPLGPQHNDADYAAWTSSIDHIEATPGFADWDWPDASLSIDDNRADLVKHAEDFAARIGFTYTVLTAAGDDVIGCVYLYPARDRGHDVHVRSWVRSDRANLDEVLWRAVSDWIAADWPFEAPQYAAR